MSHQIMISDDAYIALVKLANHEGTTPDALAEVAVQQLLNEMPEPGPRKYLAGAWSDLPEDDEFAFFDRIRHEVAPSAFIEDEI